MGNSFTNGGYSIAMFDYRRVFIVPPKIHSKQFGTQGFRSEFSGGIFSPGVTPWKINMEPTNHPFRKENDLNQPSMIMFHDNFFRGVHFPVKLGCSVGMWWWLWCWLPPPTYRRLRCGNVVYPISGIMEPSLGSGSGDPENLKGIFQVVLGCGFMWCLFFWSEKIHGDFQE